MNGVFTWLNGKVILLEWMEWQDSKARQTVRVKQYWECIRILLILVNKGKDDEYENETMFSRTKKQSLISQGNIGMTPTYTLA